MNIRLIIILWTLLSLCAFVVADGHAYTGTSITNSITGEVSDSLIRENTALQVYRKHIEVLNDCDWQGLMAQYPDQTEIHLAGGNVVAGREAVGELFAGFVQDVEDGGLCGLTFTEESRFQVGSTLNVQWVADADFLAKPYRGSDAYVSDDGLMVAMVTTFRGDELQFKNSYTGMSVTNANTGEVSDALIREVDPATVYEKHIEVLNDCDWPGLLAQYPDQAEIHLSGGTIIAGRQAIGELFAGFVSDPEDGGLCGLTFVEESRFDVAGVLNVQWVADADFLAEPYRGSDAYVTEDGLMVAMVTTFNGDDLKFK